MGIRQTMNENPGVSIGVTAGIILLVIVIILYELWPRGSSNAGIVNQAYFSTDDGKNFFPDDADKVPPFRTKDGKIAVKALVFRCGSSGKPFVAYLERYTDEGKKMMEEINKTHGRPNTTALSYMEVKKPGQGIWLRFTPQSSNDWGKVTTVTCPDGGAPEPVFPTK